MEDCCCLLKLTGFHSLSQKDGLQEHINCRDIKKRGSVDYIFNFIVGVSVAALVECNK